MTNPNTKLDELFQNAIFGGPRLASGELEAIVAAYRLPPAAVVYAVPEGSPPPDAAEDDDNEEREGAIPLVLHSGTIYWFAPLDPHEPGSSVPPGKAATSYRSTDALVHAIQHAILAMRRGELAALRKTGSAPTFSLHDEMRAFQLALHEIRKNPGGAADTDGIGSTGGEALKVWVEIVLHRGQGQINLIRLRLVELLTALTRGHEGRFAYLSASLIKTIYSEHQLPRLARLAGTIAAELAPLTLGSTASPDAGITPLSPAVRRALAIMAERFREPISLAEVAAATHVSAAHLARLFRKETGQSVVEHLQRLRINHARELLATTEHGVLEVALESGFESVEHFHRLFRRFTGTTPRLYRLQAGKP